MSGQAVKHFFLKPSLPAIVLAGLPISTMFVGHATRYAFTCQGSMYDGLDIEKPLYGIPCACWAIWVTSSAPFLYLTSHAIPALSEAMQSITIETKAVGNIAVIGVIANSFYYYVGSSLFIVVLRKFFRLPIFTD